MKYHNSSKWINMNLGIASITGKTMIHGHNNTHMPFQRMREKCKNDMYYKMIGRKRKKNTIEGSPYIITLVVDFNYS